MGFACTTPSSSSVWNFSFSSSSSYISSKRILFPPNHQKWRFLKTLTLASSSDSNYSSSPVPPQENFDASDRVKSKADAATKAESPVDNTGGKDTKPSKKSDSVRSAIERAREYKKNKGVVGAGIGATTSTGTQKIAMDKSSNLGDGSIRDTVVKEEKLKISRMDFVGINFSDKKNGRRQSAGLSQVVESLPQGVLPEVEFIIGDSGKMNEKKSAKTNSDDTDDSDIYKPKVSTWGVFPRPENISKTFGGGRTIHPGEELETAEEKAAREARIRESVAKYESRIGLNIDAKIKAKCEKALREGDQLMDLGKLQKALPYYEEIMNSVVFRSELHGLAALHWSICQDSLRRHEEARDMYDKLRTHPTVHVSKTARQFIFGFEAMEMLKVSKVSSSSTTGYENYFEAFLEEKTNYIPVEDEQREDDTLKQVLPYIFFLLSPICILLVIIARKTI